MNVITLGGRLTKDPELKFGKSGKAYARFTLAINRIGNESADFINCVAFGKVAEFIEEYFKKGRKMFLSGRLQMNQFEQDGKKLTTYIVVTDRVEFGDSLQKKEENIVSEIATTNEEVIDDEFPF
ncbi:single-stranded DNA-binding protein [Fusobacterium gastrosuis]|uniref:single-stranded DNA-binding protein n=1 Tax=Fusobacterium gastrosuis TaxID=1755100 RepID=UPI002A971565|nr:single-stranded DNA-binding protein [Fusobacterium gastrosuis]